VYGTMVDGASTLTTFGWRKILQTSYIRGHRDVGNMTGHLFHLDK